MIFLIAMLIVAISCLAITYKTLVGYGNFPLWGRMLTFFLLFVAWFSPVLLRLIRDTAWLDGAAYAVASKGAYFLMGVAFILFMLLLFRDFIWYGIYYVSHNEKLSPSNVQLLNRNNIITIIISVLLALYGVYEAHKLPNIKEINISDSKIKEDTRIVIASDLHIDKATPLWQIKQIVNEINKLNPDYILLVGDIIDDVPDGLQAEMTELEKLKAKKIYLSLGNHEYYNAPVKWMIKFTNMGFEVLQNSGVEIGNTGIFIAGIPDANSAEIHLDKAISDSSNPDEQYKILMSHAPKVAKELEPKQFNLQVSGHTHGGQIFPFHFLANEANGFLAGLYDVNGNKLYISRGAGYWGPPIRILAPSDIAVINLKAEK